MLDISRITAPFDKVVGDRGPAESMETTKLSAVLERIGIEASLADGWVPANLIEHLRATGPNEQLQRDIALALEQLGVEVAATVADPRGETGAAKH